MEFDNTIDLDNLPDYCTARVLILGVGNVLFGNDGFGPEVATRLLHKHKIPDHVQVFDAGTGVRKLLFTLTLSSIRPEEIVILDAVDWGDEVGKVTEIPAEALPTTKIDDFSLHQIPTSNMLRELQEQCGVKITVIACDIGEIPQEINPGLTDLIDCAVDRAVELIAERYFGDMEPK